MADGTKNLSDREPARKQKDGKRHDHRHLKHERGVGKRCRFVFPHVVGARYAQVITAKKRRDGESVLPEQRRKRAEREKNPEDGYFQREQFGKRHHRRQKRGIRRGAEKPAQRNHELRSVQFWKDVGEHKKIIPTSADECKFFGADL